MCIPIRPASACCVHTVLPVKVVWLHSDHCKNKPCDSSSFVTFLQLCCSISFSAHRSLYSMNANHHFTRTAVAFELNTSSMNVGIVFHCDIRFQRTYLFGYVINFKVSLAVCCQCRGAVVVVVGVPELVPYQPNWPHCENESFKGWRAQSGVALSWPGEDLWLN